MLIPSLNIFKAAREHKFGIGAFNVNNMEQLQGIVEASYRTQSPFIVQVSKNALKYADKGLLAEMVRYYAEKKYPDLPMALHLDHGPNLETVMECIDLGFTSVMIDGSIRKNEKGDTVATTLEENIAITKPVVEYAHARGVTVEAEIGTLGGIEDGWGGAGSNVTDPKEAKEFYDACHFDSLALAIGTSHGAYKFKDEPVLAMEIIDQCYELLPECYFVMHGSSTVPKDLVDMCNKYGGDVPGAKGVPDRLKVEFIERAGGPKINIDTDGRLAMTAAIRKVFVETPSAFDPRKYLGPARDAQSKWVESQMKTFNADDKAGFVSKDSLEDLKNFYEKRGF